MHHPPRHLAAAAVLALLAACALPLQPDLKATAPDLPGYGSLQWTVRTASPQAQRLFEQGVLQAYAFNEAEAIRLFKAALAQDPGCAMCAWGVAWQLGPNINNSSRSGNEEALRYLDHALRHAQGASARERALLDALALRYGHASTARETAPLLADGCGRKAPAADDDEDPPAHPLDIAYADRLRGLLDRFAGDADLLSLYAEAEMVATRDDWWNETTGKPAGRIGELTTQLEQALMAHPDHTGLNHYLIHAADAQVAARRALPAADRLGRLAPASPHLLHMPSHIFVRVGRYGDAQRVNEEAVAADLALFDAQKRQGFAISKDWRNHDQQFLWFAALMQGQGDAALQAARGLAERAQSSKHAFGEYRRSLPMLALMRLERWHALVAEPAPAGSQGLAQALGEGARAVAFARIGRVTEARGALAAADAGQAVLAQAHAKPKGMDRLLRELASAATDRARAEIASVEGRHDEALKLQAQVLLASKQADSNEPPMLAASARSVLGDLQLRAGRAAEAESSYREDLKVQPGNGWALRGLSQALAQQGRQADAEAQRADWQRAWAQADPGLKATPLRP